MADHLRVLSVASEVPPTKSGIARLVGRINDQLRSRGHHVDELDSSQRLGLRVGEFRISALGVGPLGSRSGTAGYDVLHLHGPAPTITDLVLLRHRLRARHAKLVYSHHFELVVQGLETPSRWYDSVHRRLHRAADAVVMNTPSYAARYSDPKCPLQVIPLGCDLVPVPRTVTPYDGTRRLRVLFVGQLRPYKGVPDLLAVAACSPEIELTVAGDGPGLHEAHGFAARAQNISVLGPVSDAALRSLYASHDVICLPSRNRSEAFGLVLLEGMRSGCVPVASNLPGVCDVVGPGGLLPRPQDRNDLRTALLRLAHHPALVQEYAGEALRHAGQFTWEATGAAYDRLFSDVVRSS